MIEDKEKNLKDIDVALAFLEELSNYLFFFFYLWYNIVTFGRTFMKKIIKIAIIKSDTYLGIILTDPQRPKEVSKPFSGKLCGSWQPADYYRPHIQTCQQFLIKNLTLSDIDCGLKFTWRP